MTIEEQLIRAKSDLDAAYEAGKKAGATPTVGNVSAIDWSKLEYYGVSDVRARYSARKGTVEIEADSTVPNIFEESDLWEASITVTSMGNGVYFNDTFKNCTLLKTVSVNAAKGGNAFSPYAFGGCVQLTTVSLFCVIVDDVSFVDCKRLTRSSLDEIRDSLSDSVSGKTCTFSNVAVFWAGFSYGFEENYTPGVDGGPIDYQGWTEWCAEKPNWTFSYM